MSNFGEQIKRITRETLGGVQSNPSKYRLGYVTKLNQDGTAAILMDGKVYNAMPTYPVVAGQKAVLVFADDGSFSAIPTSPATPLVENIHPPFFTGGVLRFVVDETGIFDNFANLNPVLRFQDAGSSKLYRLILSQFTNGSSILNLNYSLSKSGSNLSFLIEYTDPVTNIPFFDIVGIKLGKKLVSSGTIDATQQIFSISPPITHLLRSIGYSTTAGITREVIDSFYDDTGILYFLEQQDIVVILGTCPIGTEQQYSATPENMYQSGQGILDTILVTGALILGNFLALSGTPGQIFQTFHLNIDASRLTPSAPWMTITSQSGTISLPGFSSPVPYQSILTITAPGTGLYCGNIQVADAFGPGTTGFIEVNLGVAPAMQRVFNLYQLSGNPPVPVLVTTIPSSIGTNYDAIGLQGSFRIAGIKTNPDKSVSYKFIGQSSAKTIDFIDMTNGAATIFFSSKFPNQSFLTGLAMLCQTSGAVVITVEVTVTGAPLPAYGLGYAILDSKNNSSLLVPSGPDTLGIQVQKNGIFTSSIAGDVFDKNYDVRTLTLKSGVLVVNLLQTVPNISPGQSDPSAIRELSTDININGFLNLVTMGHT